MVAQSPPGLLWVTGAASALAPCFLNPCIFSGWAPGISVGHTFILKYSPTIPVSFLCLQEAVPAFHLADT